MPTADYPTSIPVQQQEWPGSTRDMTPVPDHGEHSYRGRERLVGKRALITGGDSGIGRATAIAFAREGARVAIAHLPQEEADAQDTREVIERGGGSCTTIAADLRAEDDCARLAEEAAGVLGGIDVLVNNAGFQMAQPGNITNFPHGQLEQVFTTNLFAAFWLTKAVVPHLSAGASIINTTSIQAFEPSEPLLDYAATKAALNNFTVNLASQLGPKGIRVNAVAPGPIWTPLIPSTFGEEKIKSFGADTPLGRPGQPVEVAAAYVFLASDEASYVSGTVLGVTGGKAVF